MFYAAANTLSGELQSWLTNHLPTTGTGTRQEQLTMAVVKDLHQKKPEKDSLICLLYSPDWPILQLYYIRSKHLY